MAEHITPITVNGRYLWKGRDRFLVNGIVLQPARQVRREAVRNSIPDPIADDQIDELKKCLPYFKELGLNTLFIYSVDPSKSHDECMKLLAKAGIYVLPCLSTPWTAIRRNDPFSSYTAELMSVYFKVIDCMAAYPNTLGMIVANEIINSVPAAEAAPVMRAVTRDIKTYMSIASDIAGQRKLPLGMSASDVKALLKPQFDYFAGGEQADAIDFFCFNCYSWNGRMSLSTSGYDSLIKTFSETHIPVFFSEYGANTYRPRIFQETRVIFSPEMTGVFSGGIVYEFILAPNQYGIVKRTDEGVIVKLEDYDNLKRALDECNQAPNTISQFTSTEWTAEHMTPRMPVPGTVWRADAAVIPKCPVNWDGVRERFEDKEWIDVADDILDLDVEDLADSIWERFRVEGTGPSWD